MILVRRSVTVLTGDRLPAEVAAVADRVVLRHDFCCTAVAMSAGAAVAMGVGRCDEAALRRLASLCARRRGAGE
ncbi:MAG: hypothetical protein KY434_08300 [Actinobacteria bacterium]|nr:hypothetical protein [Actinomycetota bacterium]